MMDRNSPTWVALRGEITRRIDKLRDDLERTGIDPEPLRGEIAGLRWVVKTVEPDAKIEEPTSTDYFKVSAPKSS
jgi:hypothetical protein